MRPTLLPRVTRCHELSPDAENGEVLCDGESPHVPRCRRNCMRNCIAGRGRLCRRGVVNRTRRPPWNAIGRSPRRSEPGSCCYAPPLSRSPLDARMVAECALRPRLRQPRRPIPGPRPRPRGAQGRRRPLSRRLPRLPHDRGAAASGGDGPRPLDCGAPPRSRVVGCCRGREAA